MKIIYLHVTAGYVASKLMEGYSRRHALHSSIARLIYMHGSLMALDRTFAWVMLCAFCPKEMSCRVK